jgi:5-methylcytosine-specific restriction endonuclease McrA
LSKQSKACNIPVHVKQSVWARDNKRCVICGSSYAFPNSHYIKRSHGGLGIEENIVTMCLECHHQYDHGRKGIHMKAIVRDYLMSKYPHWEEYNLRYKKGQ